MYQLKIKQGSNVIVVTDANIEVFTQFVEEYIELFGEGTTFEITKIS